MEDTWYWYRGTYSTRSFIALKIKSGVVKKESANIEVRLDIAFNESQRAAGGSWRRANGRYQRHSALLRRTEWSIINALLIQREVGVSLNANLLVYLSAIDPFLNRVKVVECRENLTCLWLTGRIIKLLPHEYPFAGGELKIFDPCSEK